MKKLADLEAEVKCAKATRDKADIACVKVDAVWIKTHVAWNEAAAARFKADAALKNAKNRREG